MKKVRYLLRTAINVGTEENPVEKETFTEQMFYSEDDKLERNLDFIRHEAYNGEITVEDVPDETAAPTEAERLAAVESAVLAMMGGAGNV